MDFGMNNRIPSVVAGFIHFNNYNAPLESITPLHYYTTMGFSHCSSSSSRGNILVEDFFPCSANFALSRVQNSRFTDWPSANEFQQRPTTTTGKRPTHYENR